MQNGRHAHMYILRLILVAGSCLDVCLGQDIDFARWADVKTGDWIEYKTAIPEANSVIFSKQLVTGVTDKEVTIASITRSIEDGKEYPAEKETRTHPRSPHSAAGATAVTSSLPSAPTDGTLTAGDGKTYTCKSYQTTDPFGQTIQVWEAKEIPVFNGCIKASKVPNGEVIMEMVAWGRGASEVDIEKARHTPKTTDSPHKALGATIDRMGQLLGR